MTTPRPKLVMSWSSGKDSAFALWELIRSAQYDIVGLVTTLTSEYGRVSMHGVRETLLDRQAEALGLPVFKVKIPSPCSNEIYEREMAAMVGSLKVRGVTHFAFGDLFLEDIRAYRESRLRDTGVTPVFPLWLRNTQALAQQIVTSGFEAIVSCVDSRQLDPSFAGRHYDNEFLRALPSTTDPCGENGEFHTVVTGGPLFSAPIVCAKGAVVSREGFIFADVIPHGETY